MRVIRYTKFPDNPYGDGGARRSSQIRELWQSRGVELEEEKFVLPKNYSVLQAINWVIRALVFISKYIGWKRICGIKNKYKALLSVALRIPLTLDKYEGHNIVFLWENTMDYFTMILMKQVGAKIIAYPHNLESLVPTQVDYYSKKVSPYWLYDEVSLYQLCDEVYCISKEETWLLQLFGVNAKYFPYYPPKVVETELIKIKNSREHRMSNKSKMFLILGSATNPPTKLGMQALLQYFSQKNNLPYEVHLAGYQTEMFSTFISPSIILHGTMSKEDLDNLLMSVDGLIINQATTSGALTRIVENRIAGIPIYANFGAARDFYNLADVQVYSTFDELNEMLCCVK